MPFYDFTIAATPENAVIVINSIETNSVSLEQNAVVEWSVSLLGYIEQKGILNLKEDTVLNITLEKKKFIFQITTIPDDCTIKINNQEFSSIIVDYETTVNWIVERNGYVSKSGENIVTEDTALSIELEKENYTYCIVPEPSDSTVFINGIEQTSIIVPYKTSVSYSVSRVGYEAQTGMYQVLGNFSHNIILQKKNYTFEITSNVEGATIYVNGELAVFPMVAEYGTVMNWSVTADGYTTQSDSTVLTDNIKLNITLVKKIFKVIIQPIPADSTIVIDGVETNYIEAPFMTEFQYSVSREGYATKTGAYTIINDWTLSVELDVLQYTLTINPTPENAIVTINDTVQNSITVDYGTIVNWSVSATGYETEYGAQKVTEDTVLDILMRLAYFTVTFSPTPSDATVLINDIIQNSIRAIYGTVFNWSVSAPYYISQSGSEKIEKTYTKEVILQENVSSVSLSGCTLTCSPASSKTINGSSITWVTGTSAVSASSVSASISKSSGIVSGPCKIKMVCSYLYGPNFSNWKYTLTYTIKTGNKSKSTEVNGLSATVILSEEQKLTKFTMSVGGNSNKINANTRAGCSFSLYKYI